jgi:hypothetical protein
MMVLISRYWRAASQKRAGNRTHTDVLTDLLHNKQPTTLAQQQPGMPGSSQKNKKKKNKKKNIMLLLISAHSSCIGP